jgi:tRNA-splicing endonuclease subunit Sen54
MRHLLSAASHAGQSHPQHDSNFLEHQNCLRSMLVGRSCELVPQKTSLFACFLPPVVCSTMADADEDALPTGTQTHQDDGDDGEDETQDFRFLATLTGGKASVNMKRGIKDFEPNPTQSQASALDESRLAMYNALSEVRSQSAKNHNVGLFVDERGRGNARDLALRGGLRGNDWDARCVVIYRFRSTFSRTFGRADHRSWTWLLPEEALYLLERGTLDIRWPDTPESQSTAGEAGSDAGAEDLNPETEGNTDAESVGGLPMSLQGAYATFVGRSGLDMDRYLVYTGLRRLGYVVQRAATWSDFEQAPNGEPSPEQQYSVINAHNPPSPSTAPSLITRLLNFVANPRRSTSCPSYGPLLAPGLYRNYNDVFRALTLTPYHHRTTTSTLSLVKPPSGPFTIAFDVYRPATTYKKSAPPPPDFRICVLDARATDVPTMEEIGALLDTMPRDELEPGKRAEAKIKHGKRNVILAVVDIGVVSYLRFGEAEIGEYRIYEEKTARAQKGRGRGGGPSRGGRGGARGRGGGGAGRGGGKN